MTSSSLPYRLTQRLRCCLVSTHPISSVPSSTFTMICRRPAGAPFMTGVLNRTVEWIFAFKRRISATISHADRLLAMPRQELAETVWRDITDVLGMDAPLPKWQLVRERRATFAATPEQNARRPGARTRWTNLVLAGDWTDTGTARNHRRRHSVGRARRRYRSPGMMQTKQNPAPPISRDALAVSVDRAADALLKLQQPDGHWVFELEADATIPAEYVLLRHYLGEPVDAELERKIAVYLRRIQGKHHGWPLFHDGDFDMSASVKAYFALKMIGEPLDADHMRRAREAILQRGGAARSNVFTRALLSLYGVTSWRSVPVMPVEIMLLPRWFPFHMSKISYWARTVIAPLLVLGALKPLARNPKGVGIDELFLEDAEIGRRE